MPGTSCKDAIKNWEAKTGENAAEAETVKLFCQLPPIEKMDDALHQLENCRHLSLSTNSIDRMISLPKLKNLEILSLSRNQIRRIMGLEEIGNTLKELWLSYNLLEKLDGLQPCIKLHTLFIGNNKIKSWDEVGKLQQLPEIATVLLWGNPVYGEMLKEQARPHVVKRVPNIANVDGGLISDSIRKEAEELD